MVAVDDNSPDDTAGELYRYLQRSGMRIKNRVKIVRNLEHMGATGSAYLWARKLCRPGDIVVHMDMDDRMIGKQVFKTMNALYHNPNTWYVYSRLLRQPTFAHPPNGGQSRPFIYKPAEYRQVVDWSTSAMRTFRY